MYSSKLFLAAASHFRVWRSRLTATPRQQPPNFFRNILPLLIFRDTRIIRSMWPGHLNVLTAIEFTILLYF